MDGSRTDRAHSVRKAEGYWSLASAMGEMVFKRVWWSTGSWTGGVLCKDWAGGVRGAAVGDRSTLGGGTTLGGGNAVGLADGGARAVFVFQWAKMSWRLDISDSFLWWTVLEASLTAQDMKFRA